MGREPFDDFAVLHLPLQRRSPVLTRRATVADLGVCTRRGEINDRHATLPAGWSASPARG